MTLLRFGDLVFETSFSTGTGAYELVAATGFRTFVNAFNDGDRVRYAAEKGTQREIGLGTFVAGTPNQLQRDAIVWSTEANPIAKVPWLSDGEPILIRCVPMADGQTEVYLGNFVGSGVSSFAVQNAMTPMFDEYRVRVNAINVDTSTAQIDLRVQVAGLTKAGASDYKFALDTRNSVGASAARNSDASNRIALTSAAGLAVGIEDAWDGELIVSGLTASRRTRIRYWGTYSEFDGDFAQTIGSGDYVTVADVVDGLEFLPSAGNIDVDLDVFGRIGGGLA